MKLDLMSIAIGAALGVAGAFIGETYNKYQERLRVEAAMAEDAKGVKCGHEDGDFVCRWKREVEL